MRGHCYDALVGLAGCDKSLPEMMMSMILPFREIAGEGGVPGYRALLPDAPPPDWLKLASYLADWQQKFDHVLVFMPALAAIRTTASAARI